MMGVAQGLLLSHPAAWRWRWRWRCSVRSVCLDTQCTASCRRGHLHRQRNASENWKRSWQHLLIISKYFCRTFERKKKSLRTGEIYVNTALILSASGTFPRDIPFSNIKFFYMIWVYPVNSQIIFISVVKIVLVGVSVIHTYTRKC